MAWIDIIPIFSGFTALFLGIIVTSSGSRLIEKISFALFSFAMAIWSICVGLFLLADNPDVAMALATTYYIAALLLIYGLLIFAYEFTSGSKVSVRKFSLYAAVALIPLILIIKVILIPGEFVTSLSLNAHNIVNLDQYAYSWYCVLYLLYGVLTVILLARDRISHSTSKKRTQKTIVAWLISLCLPVAAFFNLILPLFGNYLFIVIGPMLTLPVVIVFFYAIMKQSLFDIRLAVVRTATYVLSLVSLSAIYYFLAFFISSVFIENNSTSFSISPISIVLALVLAFVFQPIKHFFDRVTNFLFYRDVYSTDEFFARLTRKLSSMTDLMTLLMYSSSEISKTLKASFGSFLVYRSDGSSIYVGEDRRRTFPPQDKVELDEYVKSNGDAVIITGLLHGDDTKSLKNLLNSHRVALVLPIMQKNSVTGYLFLGEHLSAKYTPKDVRALGTIADELFIAIQNALSIQAVKDLNATLQQRVDTATKELRATNAQLHRLDETKDEFMSMASHQLRTPLTSVKGYISMVIEGDAGRVTSNQKQLLEEAFNSSERMVHLINDFLNVSRLQTGKFVIDKSVIDLSKVVAEELNSLENSASRRGMKFVYKAPKHFPMLDIDDNKIRQVIMNYCDNAIYYSKENSSIKVDLSVDDRDVIFTVKDTGIGVPVSERGNLFSKFYRASNARKQRPDGTGVGIFLAKKVVVAHGGDIIFESVENKGSTFGFRIPLSKLRPAENVN